MKITRKRRIYVHNVVLEVFQVSVLNELYNLNSWQISNWIAKFNNIDVWCTYVCLIISTNCRIRRHNTRILVVLLTSNIAACADLIWLVTATISFFWQPSCRSKSSLKPRRYASFTRYFLPSLLHGIIPTMTMSLSNKFIQNVHNGLIVSVFTYFECFFHHLRTVGNVFRIVSL